MLILVALLNKINNGANRKELKMTQVRNEMKGNDAHQFTIPTGDNFAISQGVDAFIGIESILNLGRKASPLDPRTITLKDPQNPSNNSQVSAVTDSYQQDKMLQADATINGSYGAFSGSLSSKYEREIKVSETSSTYIGFSESTLGTVFLNQDAKLSVEALNTLKSSAKNFVSKYGAYMIYGYKLSASFVGNVSVYAESESEKTKLDVAAEASFGNMFSANANFKAALDTSDAKYSMNAVAVATGTKVDVSSISQPSDIPPILAQINADLSLDSANLSTVVLSSWLQLPDVVNNVQKSQIDAFDQLLTPDLLNDYAALYAKINWMDNFLQDAINNLDTLIQRQWVITKKDHDQRLEQLREIRNAVDSKKIDEIDKNTEAQVASEGYILSLKQFVDTKFTDINTVLSLVPFTITIQAVVSSSYDAYTPKETYTLTLKIDPNNMPSRTVTASIEIDNHHSNCRHFYGPLSATYTDGTDGDGKTAVLPQLSVSTRLNRVCGSVGSSNLVTFTPGGSMTGQLIYDNTIHVDLTVNVTQDQAQNTVETIKQLETAL